MILASLLVALATAIPQQSDHPRIIILGYHEVERSGLPPHETIPRQLGDPKQSDEMARYTVSTDAFRQQLDALAQHGYTVISFDALYDYLSGKCDTLPARSAVITIDDGWISTRSEMAPELKRREWPFTAFVYSRVIDRHDHHPFNLTWDEVAALARDGVDIESHTYSHPFLSRTRHADLDDAAYGTWLAAELRDSRDAIALRTTRPVRFLAYPFGDYDAGVIAAAKDAGYVAAVTVTPGVVTRESNRFALPRYLVVHDTALEEFEGWLEGR